MECPRWEWNNSQKPSAKPQESAQSGALGGALGSGTEDFDAELSLLIAAWPSVPQSVRRLIGELARRATCVRG